MTTIAILANDTEAALAAIESYGYKLVTWSDFVNISDLPNGLLIRAGEVTADRLNDRKWVIYDPEGDHEDWLLVGERREIIRDTLFDLIEQEPPEGPLSPEALSVARHMPPAPVSDDDLRQALADLVQVIKDARECDDLDASTNGGAIICGDVASEAIERAEALLGE